MLTRCGLAVLASVLVATAGAAQEWRTDFSRHTVPLEEIVSGGPPKDGIPAIDRPAFESVAEADRWLAEREPVIVMEIGDEVRAYPLQILIWHEIVNDIVGGEPVTVTFCPLCNTALAFDREVDGRVLDFGTTGRLRHSDLVMYDRQTESWWQQATGEAIVGAYAGRRLRFIAAPVTSWREFKVANPQGRVLSRRTGVNRPYGRNPYERYDSRSSPLSGFFRGDTDARLPAMERVAALDLNGQAVAIAFSLLRTRSVINERVGDVPIVVQWLPGTASALDAGNVRDGRDVGATAVFDRRVNGRTLTFDPADGDGVRDRETHSHWDRTGRATSGPLAGRRLVAVPHGNHFWFAWAAFRPDARLVR
ncbi:MAG: DUF3179 domain-containing protein [Gemmatimonadales bacterium]|nr:DUF3179 domain-containing protein [Gemmatimonadales bacterium]